MTARQILEKAVDKWPIKALAVVAAIMLYQFHRVNALEERVFSVPLAVQTDGTLVPASAYPRMVRVTLRGEANTVFPILEEDIEAYIDLTKYKSAGVYKAPILIRKTGSAAVADPLQIQVDPLETAIAIEFRKTKLVPITPSFRGYLESGYELSSYSIEPAEIEVAGPASRIDALVDVTTEAIELTGRQAAFSVSVKLANRDSLLSIRGDGAVQFSGQIRQSIVMRSLDKQPIILSGLPEGLVAFPQTNFGTVALQGSQHDLSAYVPDASLLSIDCSRLTAPGSYLLPLIVSAPPNFDVVRYDPIEVSVEVGYAAAGTP